MLRAALRSAAGGVALGGFLYLLGDTASDFLTYQALHSAAMRLVAQDEELQQLLGTPLASGPWYNATLGFSHRDRVAHCTFQLAGSARVTDVAVKAGRSSGGPRSTILYNLAGPGGWQVLSCQAMVPSEGGLVAPRSLLPEHREEARQLAAAAAAEGKAGRQQQGSRDSSSSSSSSRSSSSSWGWWPWRRQRQHAEPAAAGACAVPRA